MRHRESVRALLQLALLFGVGGAATAAETSVSGFFDDPANTALVSSNGAGDPGLVAAQFGSADRIARNVAIYRLVVPNDGSAIRFVSSGYADPATPAPDDGAQAYFSIFAGSDGTATFVDSSYFDPKYDFDTSEVLAAGTYLFSIGVYANQSSAENGGAGTLTDGFTALAVPGDLGNDFYQVMVTAGEADFTVGPAAPLVPGGPTGPGDPAGPGNVPEPGVMALLCIGLAASGRRRAQAIRASRTRLAQAACRLCTIGSWTTTPSSTPPAIASFH